MSTPYSRSFWPMLLAVAVAALGSGCATGDHQIPGNEYVVTAPRAPWYRFGPNQNAGPDVMLDLGTRVKLVSREYGFSQVKLADGRTGYTANNDIAVAPPQTTRLSFLGPSTTSRRGETAGRPRRSRNPAPIATADPLFNVSDVPLEMPEGSAASSPKFRMKMETPR